MRAPGGRLRPLLLLLAALSAGAALAPAPVAAQTGGVAERPLLAVLPFRVHSARPIEYLGESLANLTRSRLEASGRVRVVPPQALASAAREAASDAELRSLAARLGAVHVVTGSVTELAGRYSLDVRITPSAPGEPSRSLVLTAESDDDLLARVGELSDRVLEAVGDAPKSRIARVEIAGAAGVEEELSTRLRTRAGERYDPATLREDLAILRSHSAVANASVETERAEAGVIVRFRVARSERAESAPAARPGADVVAEVRVRGNRRVESDAIRARMATRAGAVYSASGVARDVREIHSMGFFRDVQVFAEPVSDGWLLVVQVEENPIVRQISISGNDNVGSDTIRDILTLTTGSTLDYPLLFENRGRIAALYRAQGYYLAEVEHEVEPLSEAAVGIHFIVDENDKLRLKRIVFEGNEHFSDRELREGFQTRTWKLWSYATSWFDRSGTYSEPLFLQDLKGVAKKYSDAGFLQVEIGDPVVDPGPDGLVVTVPVIEGRVYRVGEIDVIGDATVDVDALKQKLGLREGEIFNRSQLIADVNTLERHYTDRGFYFAAVDPLTDPPSQREAVDVQFRVRKGPLYFIREIEISGNTTTVDPVIRREVPMVEGQLYSARAIQIARARVEGLGFFEEVDFQPQPTEERDQLDLEIDVVERPTGSFSFGAGFSSQDKLVVTGSLSQTNLFGRGYAAQLSVDFGGRSQRFFASLNDPYFLGSTFSLGVTLFNTSVRFEDFDQSQTGADLVLGHALSDDNRSRGFLRYSFGRREIDEDSNVNAASVILRELEQGTETISLLGLSFTTDRRDDRLAPRSGYQLGGSLEGSGLGGFSKFIRTEGRAAFYLGAPSWLPKRSTFVVSSRAGYALPLNDISDFDFDAFSPGITSGDGQLQPLQNIDDDQTLPLSERYFLGGLGQFQLRGFKARSVGPRRPILTQAFFADSGVPIAGQFVPVGRVVDFNPAARDNVDAPDLSTFCVRDGFITRDDEGFIDNADESRCNQLGDEDTDDFENPGDTDVIGGNKFITSSFEYRFPISETLGLQGVLFLDAGNAFAEGDNLFDATEWRYGTGAGVQWFSPFGPLMVVLGFPLDQEEFDDSPVFEFSVGGLGL